MWTWNEVHFYLWERTTAKVVARLQRRLAGLVRSSDGSRDRPQARHEERRRMPDLETPTVAPATLGRLLLSRLNDPQATEAIMAACREELRREVHEAAVAEARATLEEAFSDRREQLLDQLDRQRRQIERDADARAELEAQATLAEEAADWQERLDEVRTERRDALARAQQAEALVVSLLTQLCGGVDQKAVYLYSGGAGVQELDKHAANTVLARAGVVLKSKATASERRVRLTLDEGRQADHVLFWLSKVLAAGVADEDAEALDEMADTSRQHM